MAKAQRQKQASTPIVTVPPTDGATEVRFHTREALERLHDEVLAPLKMLSLLLSTCAEGLAIESSDLRGVGQLLASLYDKASEILDELEESVGEGVFPSLPRRQSSGACF